MNFKEAYSALGLPDGASKDEAKKAFRKLAQKLHPDVNKAPDAETQFKKINEAYQVIESGKLTGEDAHKNNNPSYYQNHQDIENILRNMRGQNYQNIRTIEDISLQETISFKESIIGCKKNIKYNRHNMCSSCNGEGQRRLHNGCAKCSGTGTVTQRSGNMIFQQTCSDCRGRVNLENCDQCKTSGTVTAQISFDVTIPGGVVSGNVLRLGGVGNFAGMMFGQAQYSNVNVHITVTPFKDLYLDGNDIVTTTKVSLLQALTGANVIVPTIDGDKEIPIPKSIKNREEIVLDNLGVNRLGKERVIVEVTYPQDTESLIDFLKQKETN